MWSRIQRAGLRVQIRCNASRNSRECREWLFSCLDRHWPSYVAKGRCKAPHVSGSWPMTALCPACGGSCHKQSESIITLCDTLRHFATLCDMLLSVFWASLLSHHKASSRIIKCHQLRIWDTSRRFMTATRTPRLVKKSFSQTSHMCTSSVVHQLRGEARVKTNWNIQSFNPNNHWSQQSSFSCIACWVGERDDSLRQVACPWHKLPHKRQERKSRPKRKF